MKDHVGDEHIKRCHERFFDSDIIIDTLCERMFSSLCLTWGHLHKGGLDYRRMKTKRLTRLSVYVEHKNVCKWSLVYLHVGKLL